MENTFDHLYGGKGIDTPYEREKITYRPDLNYTKRDLIVLIRPEIQQSIERARTFTISHNLLEYDELISEINQILTDIERRNNAKVIGQFKEILQKNNLQAIFEFERNMSGYDQTGDYELYSMLYFMRESIQERRDFIDQKFRIQITDETEIDAIEEAELKLISEWETLEAYIAEGYKNLSEVGDEDDHPVEDNTLYYNKQHLAYEELEKLEKKKRTQEIFHTTLADTSYVHRNRYFMFVDIIEKAKILTYEAESLISDGLKEFILRVSELNNFTAFQAQLIHRFKKIKQQQESLKGKLLTIDDGKEEFGSEKNYFYQQLETKTAEPIKNWLYEQEEGVSNALDKFAHYMISSIQDIKKHYEETLADMLNFYQSESHFYEKQINFLKEKEEIRRFYSILKDLEEVEYIHSDWVTEYLQTKEYQT